MVFGLEFVIAGRFGPEFAVAGWVGLELFIARPLQRDLGLDCGYPIGRVEKCLFLWP